MTPPLSQSMVWTVSQTVLGFCTNLRAQLSLRVPPAVTSSVSSCVVTWPACQDKRSWCRTFSVDIKLYAEGGAPFPPSTAPSIVAPESCIWHIGMFICPEL